MPLGMEVDLGRGYVLDGDPAARSPEGGTAAPPSFSVHVILCPNGRPSQLLLGTCSEYIC